jgi:hypothetical protein
MMYASPSVPLVFPGNSYPPTSYLSPYTDTTPLLIPLQQPTEGGEDVASHLRRSAKFASIILLVLAFLGIGFYFLFTLVIIPYFFPSGGAIYVPVCTGVSSLAMRLVYNPNSNSVKDISGLGCAVDLGGTQITNSGVDPVIGPYWMGYHQRAFNFPGCTSYTTTQWMQIQDAVMLSNRIMTIYSTIDPSTGPFPLTLFLAGCGISVLGSHSYAIPQNTWLHLGIVYDGIHQWQCRVHLESLY